MSRIYFHTPSGEEAELHGSERAYMGTCVRELTESVLQLDRLTVSAQDRAWLLERTTTNTEYVYDATRFPKNWLLWFGLGWDEGTVRVRDQEVSPFLLQLNTAIALGSPVYSLMAKLHGACEIHAWIDTEDADWVADTIDQGRLNHVLRHGQGWEQVSALCRRVATGEIEGPIVTSYSVCMRFPNSDVADWTAPMNDGTCPSCVPDHERWPTSKCETCNATGKVEPERDDDAWYALPEQEQWDLAMKGLRDGSDTWGGRIGPDHLHVGFGSGLSAYDLMDERWQESIAQAEVRRGTL